MAAPTYFDHLNMRRGAHIPASLNYDSWTFDFFENLFYERLISRFDFTIPENWNHEWFEGLLFISGYMGVFNTNKYANGKIENQFGILPFSSTYYGIGIQWQPTNLRAVNRATKLTMEGEIGKDVSLIQLRPNFHGAMDIVDYYAKKAATISSSIDSSLVIERIAWVLGANNKAAAFTLQEIMDRLASGQPYMVVDKQGFQNGNEAAQKILNDNPFEVLDFNVGNNYISDKLLADYATIVNQFDTAIGIRNNPSSGKKERVIVDEVNANNEETMANVTTWLKYIKAGFKQTMEVFPELEGKLDVRFTKYSGSEELEKEEGDQDAMQ